MRAQVLGHRLSSALIPVEHIVAESFGVHVKRNEHILRLYVRYYFNEHIRKAKNCVRGLPAFIGKRAYCVERSVY